jgi:hypothetical protein
LSFMAVSPFTARLLCCAFAKRLVTPSALTLIQATCGGRESILFKRYISLAALELSITSTRRIRRSIRSTSIIMVLRTCNPIALMLDRAWQFRTVGYGHDLKTWADILSALRLVGYDYVVSIEHEDGLMSVDEGFTKAVQNLQQILIREPLGEMWWV